jgi:bacterioferritin-associated ferredoxin
MTRFKDYLQKPSLEVLERSTVSLTSEETTLHLLIDKKDLITKALYSGPHDPLAASLAHLIVGRSINEASHLGKAIWEDAFREDESFWEYFAEESDELFNKPLELLKATIDLYLGREHLYEDSSPLVCLCFGIREADIVHHLKTHIAPTLATLQAAYRVGMGCRSCLPQVKRYLSLHAPAKDRYFKERSRSSWILQADQLLKTFEGSKEWGMEIESFKGKQMVISYQRASTQKEVEEMSKKVQLFFAGALDADLAFFLRRALQAENALG